MSNYKLLSKALLGVLFGCQLSYSDALLLNEYNAVASDQQLKNNGYDTYYGDINGNGGSWIELAVVEDFIDLRGAIIDIEKSKGVHQLTASFPNLTELAYLRKGTIITISQEPTNLSYSPSQGDWTINLNKNDLENIDGSFEISDRTMDISIKSIDNSFLMRNSGEIVKGWGIDNQEVFKLKKDPNSSINPDDPAYGDDAPNKQIISTFSLPNQWIDSNDTTHSQDFSSLRDLTNSSNKMVLLNEYDAVAKNKKLRDGGSDTYFGRIKGNGGSWVELVILKDKADLRKAIIKIVRNNGKKTFRAELPNIEALSNLRSGTILTISNKVATDLSYDPFNNCNPDWNINININDLNILEGKFKTNHRNDIISMLSGSGGVTILPESGEGISGKSVNKKEVYKLKKDPSLSITPTDSAYRDDNNTQALSSFGSPNHWRDSGSLITQDFTNLRLVAMEENFRRQNTSLLLNEYNAVATDRYLKGSGSDDYYGYIQGNGGSWLEMVVTQDYLNLQNATIRVNENCTQTFSAKLPELLSLAYLRKGTIVTISNEPTEMNYSPFAPNSPDWKLNINVNDLTDKNGTFNLNDNKIDISIVKDNRTILAHSGEGVWGSVVDNQEVYKLKVEPNYTISPFNSGYGDDGDDTVISTFNSPNRWLSGSSEVTQQFTLRDGKDLNEVGGIVLSNITGLEELRDGESLEFVAPNNSLWITDDDSHHVYEMDYTTKAIKSVISDADLGNFAPEIGVCGYEYHKGACDIESVAYDSSSDNLYIFTGKSPGTPAIFKLTRADVNSSFTLSDYIALGTIEYSATTFIGSDFIVASDKSLYKYNFETNTTGDVLYTTPKGKIVGLAYDKNSTTLWVTTSDFEILKVNWDTKETLAIYKSRDNGVYDPRGIEIMDNKIHILEGVNASNGDITAPIGHPLKNAIHIYQIP